MKSITYLILALTMNLFLVPVLCNGTMTNSEQIEWNMIKQLGKKNNINNWILYHDISRKDFQWNKFWFEAMKSEQGLGFFSTENVENLPFSNITRITKKEKKSDLRSLHLYVHTNLDYVNKYILSVNTSFPNSNQPLSDIWLLRMSKTVTQEKILELMDNLKISNGKQMYCYLRYKNADIKVYNVKKADFNSNAALDLYSVLTGNQELKVHQHELLRKQSSLEGVHLQVLAAFAPPSVTYIEDGCTSKDCFKGIFANVFHALSDQMNFTFTIKRAYMWGSFTNGTWNGMVGMLKDGIADIAAADLTITNERSTVVDFLPSLMEITEELYMKNPGDAFSTGSYIGAFTQTSWTAIALWIIVTPLLLQGILMISTYRNQDGLGIFNCYLFVTSSVVNLTYKLKSDKLEHRIAFISLLIGGMLIYYYWEAELTSHLASRRIDFPFSNLLEFSKNSKFNFIVAKGTIHLDYFKNSEDSVRSKIWREKLEPYFDQLPLFEELPERILADPHAVAYTESIIKMTKAYITCKIVDIKPPIRKTHLAFATQKNSPYFQAFKHHINKLKEAGVVQKYIKSHQMEAQICKDFSGGPITIQQCYTAFQILAAGASIAILGFILEMFLRPKVTKTITNIHEQNTKKMMPLDDRSIMLTSHVEKQGCDTTRKTVKIKNNESKNVSDQYDQMIALDKTIAKLQRRRERLRLGNFNQIHRQMRKNLEP